MPGVPHAREGRRAVQASSQMPGRRCASGGMEGAGGRKGSRETAGGRRRAGRRKPGSGSAATMSQATAVAIPCAACKQPVIEKRTLDGALVVLDAATRRLHLCVKRKEVEAAKAKQIAAARAKPSTRPAPRPPVKR